LQDGFLSQKEFRLINFLKVISVHRYRFVFKYNSYSNCHSLRRITNFKYNDQSVEASKVRTGLKSLTIYSMYWLGGGDRKMVILCRLIDLNRPSLFVVYFTEEDDGLIGDSCRLCPMTSIVQVLFHLVTVGLD
jgi:hypothetical protein